MRWRKDALPIFCLDVSYNEPKFSSCTNWSINATRYPSDSTTVPNALGLFIDPNDTVYVSLNVSSQIWVWSNGDATLSRNIDIGSNQEAAFFVDSSQNIFIGTNNGGNTVRMWTTNSSSSITVLNSNDLCGDIFMDIYNNIYCSLPTTCSIIKQPSNAPISGSVVIAGFGGCGNTSDKFRQPRGIFITTF
jgi:hypothetical protein